MHLGKSGIKVQLNEKEDSDMDFVILGYSYVLYWAFHGRDRATFFV
jgi:predicted nucleotidyltransferase